MSSQVTKVLAGLAAIAALALGGSALAGAATSGSSSSSSSGSSSSSQGTAAPQGQPPQGQPPQGGPGGARGGHVGANGKTEVLLTGDTAAKVKAAALAKVPGGTVERVETDVDHGSP